ncbi:MAG: MoaD/ThiS family protein [Planctomycetota bacterium]
MPSEQLEILLFGPQAESVGDHAVRIDGIEFPVAGRDVLQRLETQFPALGPSMAVSRLAVNHEFVDAEHLIVAGDEVALIGLISGG